MGGEEINEQIAQDRNMVIREWNVRNVLVQVLEANIVCKSSTDVTLVKDKGKEAGQGQGAFIP